MNMDEGGFPGSNTRILPTWSEYYLLGPRRIKRKM